LLSVQKMDSMLLVQNVGPSLSLPGTGLCTPVLRQNSESTELHFLTMLQPCLQAVDLKVNRHFGEGHGPIIFPSNSIVNR
jgi:hypothetical protein